MENISLAIITDDGEYGKALGMAILNICSDFVIKIFSWEEFFNERRSFYFSNSEGVFSNKFDLILWDGEEAAESYGEKIVLISSDPAKAVKNYSDKKFCLYKYSTARSMVSSLFDIYSFLTGKRAVNLRCREVRMIAFASYAGGTGCTTLAMAVGQEMCRFQGKRVLYISFEEIESVGEFMDSTVGLKGVGVYLYHLFKKENGYPFLESYVTHDDFGLEAFVPTGGRNPLRNLNEEEFNVFMASLIDCGRYDVILMDIGNYLSELGMMCMELAGKICLVTNEHRSGTREIQYLQHLICCCGENVMDKITKIENMVSKPKFEEVKDMNEESMIDTSIKVNKCKEFIYTGGFKRIILEGNFGENIKRLTEKILEPINA